MGAREVGRAPGSWGPPCGGYCAATTVSWVAAAAVAWGEVVAHETAPAVFVHEYQAPPLESCTLVALVVAGAIVKATAFTFVGVVASSVYWTFVAV